MAKISRGTKRDLVVKATDESDSPELRFRLDSALSRIDQLESRYRDFHKVCNLGFLVLDRACRIIEASTPAVELLTNSPSGSLIRRPLLSFLASGSVRAFQEHLSACIRSDSAQTCDLLFVVDSQIKPVRVTSLRNRQADTSGYFMTVGDRSELVLAQSEMQRALQRWYGIVNSAPDLILSLTVSGGIVFANRNWLPLAASELVGRELRDLFPPPVDRRVYSALAKTLERGVVQEIEVMLQAAGTQNEETQNEETQEESALWFNLRFGPSFSERPASAATERITLIVRNITREKTTELALKQRTKELRLLSARTDQVLENERARVSREIHDELGQLLTVLKMDASWIQPRLGLEQEALAKRIQAMNETLDVMVKSVRRISTGLGPSLLRELGLIAALEWHLEQFEERSGIRCLVKIRRSEVPLRGEHARAVFRVVQEALTNVVRHSGATRLLFYLGVRGSKLMVTIRDNGRGIALKARRDPVSVGLIGMRERIENAGGTFRISSTPHRGTLVSIELPIQSN